MKIAVFNCPFGASAESLRAALIDAGVKERGRSKTVSPFRRVLRRAGIQKCFIRNLGIGKKGDPGVLKLLQGFVLNRLPVAKELVTREGAAILSACCEREISIPALQLEQVGFGPDKVMVSIGKTIAPFRRERVVLLETNIDDMSPQGFELLYRRLFKAGALDVWVEPILMKKMRPAFKLSVLLAHRDQDKISKTVFKETPTLGVRFLEVDRFSLPRKIKRVRTRYGPVRMKLGLLDSEFSSARPEYEDVARIARRRKLPFKDVYRRLLFDYHRRAKKEAG